MKYLLLIMVVLLSLTSIQAQSAQPKIVREEIEWCDIWIPGAQATDLPRVLLIGDSITRAYYPLVDKSLKGKASIARLATSKSIGDPALLTEIVLVMRQYKFEIVHFNNGMHGRGYTEEDYRQHFPELVAAIKKYAPHATLIWATTTPVRVKGKLDEIDSFTGRVKNRNKIASDYLLKQKTSIDDLFTLVESHPEYYKDDGVHFNDQGIAAQAAQVTTSISQFLNKN